MESAAAYRPPSRRVKVPAHGQVPAHGRSSEKNPVAALFPMAVLHRASKTHRDLDGHQTRARGGSTRPASAGSYVDVRGHMIRLFFLVRFRVLEWLWRTFT